MPKLLLTLLETFGFIFFVSNRRKLLSRKKKKHSLGTANVILTVW
uniref:Uncharacterized protein n=1 Tax=Anguilla anguilla TaxID=7936 RepID=A0A0E9RGA3_ANGAN